MEKPTKVFLGLASLWPFAYMFVFFGFIFLTFLLAPSQAETGSGLPATFALIFGLHLLTILVTMALTIYYIVDVFRNDRVDKDKKALWAIVIFMGNMIAMPIYWYLYIWKERVATARPAPGQLNSVDTSSWTNEASRSHREERQYVPPREPPNWRE